MAEITDNLINFTDPLFFYLQGFTLLPYFRMTQRTKYFKNAQRYLANHTALKKRLSASLEEQNRQPLLSGYYFPNEMPFQLLMLIGDPATNYHKCDLDNLVKSVLDGAQGLLYKDDRFCDSFFVQRHPSPNADFLHLCFAPVIEDPLCLFQKLLTR